MKTPKHITNIKLTKTYCMGLKDNSDIFFDKYTTDMGLSNWDGLFEVKYSREDSQITKTTIYIIGIHWNLKIFEIDGQLEMDEIRAKIYELMEDEENLLFLNQNHPYFHFTYHK